MADHVIALATDQNGPSPDTNGLISEDVTITGDGAGTSGVYRTKFVKRPLRVNGGFQYAFSGRQVTLTSAAFSGVRSARIMGHA